MPKPRIMITGVPRSGKTTLAMLLETYGLSVFHTDSVIGTNTYKQQAHIIAGLFDEAQYDVYEGCGVAMGLVEWLDIHPNEAPCDLLLVARGSLEFLTPSQQKFNIYLMPILNKVEDLILKTPKVTLLYVEDSIDLP